MHAPLSDSLLVVEERQIIVAIAFVLQKTVLWNINDSFIRERKKERERSCYFDYSNFIITQCRRKYTM